LLHKPGKEENMARIIRLIGGTMLLILGLAGIFLPFLQGGLFLILGALLLSVDIPAVRRLVCWTENRFPRFGKALQWARRFLGQESNC
jgi:uncharacterized membrane protein YbaN (DUF454 family)